MFARPKIGLIGGLGPLAGADVTAKVFQCAAEIYGAVEDYEYPPLVLVSLGIKGFDGKGTVDAGFEKSLLTSVQQLNKLEPGIVGVACNTAHLFYGRLAAVSTAPVINLIEKVSETVRSRRGLPLLLSSSTTKNLRLYTAELDALGTGYVVPNAEIQKLVDEAIYMVMAHKLPRAGRTIDKIVESLASKGFDFIVAACTELPIAISYSRAKNNYPVVDSNQILARALTDYYYQSSAGAAHLLH